MTELITRFGALGIFVLMVPESACIPVPSEVTLLFSGFAVSQHWMSFIVAVAAATAGNVIGSLIAYGIGATSLLARSTLLKRSAHLLDGHPLRSVFIARLLPLARTFVSLPAGARHLPMIPFIALTAVGCALWAVAFIAAGTLAGTAWTSVSSTVGQVSLAGALLARAVLVLSRRRRSRSGR